MEVVFLYIVIAVCAFAAYRNRRKTTVGVIKHKKHTYGYVLGDYLQSEDTSFHGIDITLPYSLANFYLDSHKDSKRQGPGMLFDASQRLALEGDFNTHFQLFVPKDSAVLVLSILGPDVMQTLIHSSGRYDVELRNQHLRIISAHKVFGTAGQAQLLHAASSVLSEIEHRAASWPKNTAPPQQLRYRKGVTLKLAGRYLRRSRVLTYLALLLTSMMAFGLGLIFYYTSLDPNFNDPFSKGVFAGTIMYAATFLLLAAMAVVMLAPIVWFFGRRQGKDIFPGS
jgi:hypothetical protein